MTRFIIDKITKAPYVDFLSKNNKDALDKFIENFPRQLINFLAKNNIKCDEFCLRIGGFETDWIPNPNNVLTYTLFLQGAILQTDLTCEFIKDSVLLIPDSTIKKMYNHPNWKK